MSIKILIIEDTEDTRAALVIAFTEAGFRVAAATTGEEAFDELRTFAPDIVLLDMNLPGMSGLDILRELRQTLSVPIIMYTNAASKDVIRDSLAAGATDYVLKDTGMEELIDRVKMRHDASLTQGVRLAEINVESKPVVVYVGQDSTMMRLVADTSKRLFIESTRVSTAKVALIRAENGQASVIVTELELRDGDGMSLVKAINSSEAASKVPVVLVAGNAPPELRRSALSHGAAAFYIKPVSSIDFELVLRKVLPPPNRAGAA